jgi:hypothetical protein
MLKNAVSQISHPILLGAATSSHVSGAIMREL